RAEHMGRPPIGHRALVEIAADQRHAALLEPRVHFFARETALRLLAAEPASGAVHGRIERGAGFLAVDAFDDHRVITHRAADEAALTGKRRCRTLAHDPQVALAVAFAPGVVVVSVHAIHLGAADDLAHALANPLAARIRIAA